MSVVLVGGNDRMETRYKNICKAYNFKAKVFIKMPADFENKIGKPDLVVVFTDTCSHKMLNGVKHKADECNLKIANVRSASVSSLKSVLEEHCRSMATA